jgi:uncharacterized protein YndB with AHSA1/START domain
MDDNTLTITRRFKASRERVFAAFASVEAMKLWLGPGPCGVVSGTSEFRVGGSYKLQMNTPHGPAELSGRYREIAPPSRLVFTWKWNDPDAPETVVTISLTAFGNETEMVLTHTGFTSGESKGNHNMGWAGSFEKLDVHLAA